MRYRIFASILFAALALAMTGRLRSETAGFDPTQSVFGELLNRHVRDGRVDYAALKRERGALETYLREIAAIDAPTVARWTRAEQLAYWLNAYNAFVLATIVDHYPIQRGSWVGIAFPANSIWQIPGAFKEQRFSAGGRRVSLDDIEHAIIRPGFHEPRVHMALVCAARSCPDLRSEPYRAADLEAQLDDQTRRFIADSRKGVRFDVSGTEVHLSRIFKWFAEDFAMLGVGEPAAGVLEFVARYSVEPARAAALRSGKLHLRYLDYDWTLNE